MTKAERTEAGTFIASLVAALLAAPGENASALGAELRRACGELNANFVALFGSATIGNAFRACFDAALAAGATLDSLARVRLVAEAMAPSTWTGFVVRQTAIRFCLVEEARALALAKITTRTQAETLLDRFNQAFDDAEELAADVSDPETYRALIELHSAVVRDLCARARSLPEVVSITYPRALPALYIANRLYGDAGRSAELVEENRAVHPAFMPRDLTALTA